LLEVQSQARRYVKIAVLSRRRPRGGRPKGPRGGRPKAHASQASKLVSKINEIMPVIYANGEIMI
jgi:hypothetical protein